MKGINHVVLAARDLDRIRSLYAALGFTLTATGQHPFGTANAVVQLHGTYLELLTINRPQDIVEHQPGAFSFSAFNRDYLARHEGFSMLVLDSEDAAADRAAWATQGLQVYAPFDFARQARLPDGTDVTIGFSLAFTSLPAAPWIGLFSCQHLRPDYFAQPRFMTHRNGARRVSEVWISGPGAIELAEPLSAIAGSRPVVKDRSLVAIPTAFGEIILASEGVFESAFGIAPPHGGDGPHLAGLTIGCRGGEPPPPHLVTTVGARRVVHPADGFGTAIAFVEEP